MSGWQLWAHIGNYHLHAALGCVGVSYRKTTFLTLSDKSKTCHEHVLNLERTRTPDLVQFLRTTKGRLFMWMKVDGIVPSLWFSNPPFAYPRKLHHLL